MNRKALLMGFLAGFFALCGCRHLPPRCEGREPPPVPKALADRFASAGRKIVATRETEPEVRRSYQIKQIELTVGKGGTNVQILLDVYQPNRGRSPIIVLLPMAGGDYMIEHLFARYFVQRGFAVVIAQRRKIPREDSVDGIDLWLEESVRDNRFALDWIETRPELDASRIALFGISTGGIRGVLLTAVDRRIRAAALGLTGGDLPYILTHSTETGIVRRREQYLRENGATPAQLQRKLQEAIHCDPNALAGHIDCRKVLLVLAKRDTVVPIKKGLELRDNLGCPETLLLPTGHYTAALAIPWIEWKSLRFFRKQLGVKPRVGEERLRSPKEEGGRGAVGNIERRTSNG